MSTPGAVRSIVSIGNGRIRGKTRLQKSAYLLEAFGLGYGFDFSYYYYGPYSEELSTAAVDAEALGMVRVSLERTQSGLRYTVYEAPPGEVDITGEPNSRRSVMLKILEKYDPVSLELAATANFLMNNGFEVDPWAETEQRKSAKATAARLASARTLLTELRSAFP